MAELIQLPEDVQRLVEGICPEAEVRLAACGDLALDGSYGEQWVVLASERVLVCTCDDGRSELRVNLPLADISKLRVWWGARRCERSWTGSGSTCCPSATPCRIDSGGCAPSSKRPRRASPSPSTRRRQITASRADWC